MLNRPIPDFASLNPGYSLRGILALRGGGESTPDAGWCGRIRSGESSVLPEWRPAQKTRGHSTAGRPKDVKPYSGTLCILPSKFAPSTKDRPEED